MINQINNDYYICPCQQQSVNQAGSPMTDYKKNIESNFKSLKAGLVPKDKDSVPKLPQAQKEW